jgi:hypothetical protein
MATVAEMIEEVTDIVQDASFTDAAILALLNKGLTYIASRQLLPDLEMAETVTTVIDANMVPLPDDFMRNLHHAQSVDPAGYPIKVYLNPVFLLRDYGAISISDPETWVTAVAQRGRDLLYARRPPVAQAIEIRYHRHPDALTWEEESPDCLPLFAHETLVHWVCYKIFNSIEDGIDGQKINTQHYMQLVQAGMVELENHLKHGISLPPAAVVRGEFL